MNPFRNVVVGIDLANADRLADDAQLAPASRTARDKGVAIARRSGATLHLLAALDIDPYAESIVQRAAGAGSPSILESAKSFLTAAAEPARAAGVAVTTEVALGRPVETLLADVQRNRRDLVIVGTRERSSLARNLLGSTALSLLRRAPVPVWVARRSAHETEKVVLAAIGIGDLAVEVLRAAAGVAAATGAALHVLHVVDLPAAAVLRAGAADRETVEWYRRQRRERAETEVPRLVAEALGEDAKCSTHLVDGETADAVLEHARRLEADLVVMGSVVQSGVRALLLGSTAEKVLPAVETSLLLVKPTAAAFPAHR
jgi:nucleotide-binding universal stress UspA family protein